MPAELHAAEILETPYGSPALTARGKAGTAARPDCRNDVSTGMTPVTGISGAYAGGRKTRDYLLSLKAWIIIRTQGMSVRTVSGENLRTISGSRGISACKGRGTEDAGQAMIMPGIRILKLSCGRQPAENHNRKQRWIIWMKE